MEKMKIFKMVINYIKKYKLHLVLYTVFSIILWTISILAPFIMGKLIDTLITNRRQNAYYLMKVLIFIGVIEIFITYYQNIVTTKFETNVGFDLNFHILQHVKKLPLQYFNKMNTTYLNQRINNDSISVTNFIIENYFNIILKIGTFIFVIIYIFKVNYRVGIYLSILIPLDILLYFRFKKPLYITGYEFKEEQNNFFAKMNDQLYNIKLIKINSWFTLLDNELIKQFKILFMSAMKYAKLSFLFSNIDLTISKISTLILFSYGGIEVLNKRLTIGNFTIINAYFAILLSSTTYLLNLGKSYQNALISYNRINEILYTEIECNGNRNIDNIISIELQNVNFSYENKQIINNLSYKFEIGNIYCIHGENGCGKSTLINLIMGLFTNFSGNILYNSYDIKELDLYNIRKTLFGITEQEPILINDTFKNNITYGLNGISNENIYKWCKAINIYDLLLNSDKKINTIISDKSSNVSGGEKQKLSLVRTFIKEAQVIILDEPTSALDKDSILALKSILIKIKSTKIIIFITHDNSIFDIADYLIDLNT